LIDTAKKLLTGSNEVFMDMSYTVVNDTTALLVASNGLELEVWTIDTEARLKNVPKYVSGISFEKIAPESILLKTSVTAPTCDEQGYTTYTCICGESVVRDYTSPHEKEVVGIAYPNGYDKCGIMTLNCLGCDAGESEAEAPALFVCVGYSVTMDGRGGIAVGFEVNNIAVMEYETLTGKSVRYGGFAVGKNKIENNEIFDENGNIFDGALCADITEYEFSVFTVQIVGFTDTQKDLPFAIGAYIEVIDSGKSEYSYIQRELPNENEVYHFVSYNYIVNLKQDEEDEVEQ
jgi:hypothetical protein